MKPAGLQISGTGQGPVPVIEKTAGQQWTEHQSAKTEGREMDQRKRENQAQDIGGHSRPRCESSGRAGSGGSSSTNWLWSCPLRLAFLLAAS